MGEAQTTTIPAWIPSRTAEMDRREKLREELQERIDPCPFCERVPKLHMADFPGSRDALLCQCGASMAFDGKTVFYLIQQWNTRVAKKCA